jgi:hypothetical protein
MHVTNYQLYSSFSNRNIPNIHSGALNFPHSSLYSQPKGTKTE